ncbi:hypothetical protein DL89DRAFT_266714 [Linderina pennispora]|uniref:Uncharacterized protein n=1 Tax=Linderina pennispora TaxID=61395 RepID=A0A1Y1WAE5_9FUNG|nr:uncharacterized protein DL89DRAFT_266714 [Linderina pennispora]ORX70501.1 hypothetical protein DL89DRAFT_266714 [Linderina pennispora]
MVSEPIVLTFTQSQLEGARAKRIKAKKKYRGTLCFTILAFLFGIVGGGLIGSTAGRKRRGSDLTETDAQNEIVRRAGVGILVTGSIIFFFIVLKVIGTMMYIKKLRATDAPPELFLSGEAKKRLKRSGNYPSKYKIVVVPDDTPTDSS